jgi:hypothetical protein
MQKSTFSILFHLSFMLQRLKPLVPNKLQVGTDGFSRRTTTKKEIIKPFETTSSIFLARLEKTGSGGEVIFVDQVIR